MAAVFFFFPFWILAAICGGAGFFQAKISALPSKDYIGEKVLPDVFMLYYAGFKFS